MSVFLFYLSHFNLNTNIEKKLFFLTAVVPTIIQKRRKHLLNKYKSKTKNLFFDVGTLFVCKFLTGATQSVLFCT